ncbi:MAG: GspE/PulE family protein [bacterium]|nr:GspE/PulE family protein [bacterium]
MVSFEEEKQNKDLEELRREEEEELVEMLAGSKYNLPYINLVNQSIDNEALRSIPEEEARSLAIAPFKLSGKNISIGVRSPSLDLLNKLTEKIERQNLVPVFYMMSLRSLEKVWDRYKELSMAESSRAGGIEISGVVLREIANKITKIKDIGDLIIKTVEEEKIHKISHLLEIILAGAIAIKASDVHIEPEKGGCRVRLRLDGVLQDIAYFKMDVYPLLSSRIKLLSGVKLNTQTTQDGRFSIVEGSIEINIRTSLIPGTYGDSISMRVLDPSAIQIEMEDMGMDLALFKIVEQEIDKPNGLILVTGPTGSGKTTTLYSFLRKVSSSEINIITIEDPVEYHLPGITQTQINPDENYTFPEGLRSALRQDPDVIMVGEIRDEETAKIAVQAAMTGHLVFSTLHTNNAAGTIPRLIDLGVNPKILISALSLSMAQRLARKLCVVCKKERDLTPSETELINSIINDMKKNGKDLIRFNLAEKIPSKVFSSVGCEKCNLTGYSGRIGIFEAIKTDENIEKVTLENPSEREIKKIAKKQGILSMREDGIVKILSGITSIEEVQSVVDLREE